MRALRPHLLPASVGLGVALVAFLAARPVWRAAAANPHLPQWDMAKYGASGLGLADALARFDLGTFSARVWELDVWPPLFPLAEAAVFLVAGDGFATPRLLVAAFFFLSVLAAGWAAFEVDRPLGAAWAAVAAAVAAAFVAASPFFHLFGALVMLEVPGALLLLVSVACCARWLATGRRGWWTAACATALALFFTKFNYGLLWIAPMLAHEAWRRAGSAGELGRRLGAGMTAYRWRRPWPLFVVVALLLVASIPLSGGWDFTLFGTDVRATSTGNPLYVLYLLAVLRFAALPGPRRWLLARLRAADRVWRTAVFVLALPVAVWMLWPEHTKELLGFVENRSSHLPFAEALLFYPGAFVDRFHGSPGLGLAALATALVSCLRLPRLAPGRRVVALALLVGLAALLLHPYKVERFLSPVAPLVWLAAASAFGEAARQVALRLPGRLGPAVPAVVVLGALALALRAGVDLPSGAPAWNPAWPPEGGRWDELRALLAADPRFVRLTERSFPAAGYRLTVYASSAAGRAAGGPP
ncbi:MAG TPA: hypothetical protein VHM02_07740 [Thermoanaerobaculia bacterium]|nr:hypothetical protein [Thermoanaerobaculia bacterium]